MFILNCCTISLGVALFVCFHTRTSEKSDTSKLEVWLQMLFWKYRTDRSYKFQLSVSELNGTLHYSEHYSFQKSCSYQIFYFKTHDVKPGVIFEFEHECEWVCEPIEGKVLVGIHWNSDNSNLVHIIPLLLYFAVFFVSVCVRAAMNYHCM